MTQRRAAWTAVPLALFTIGALALSGCSGSNAAAPGDDADSILLERPAGSTNDKKVYDDVLAACEETTGVTIETQDVPYDGYLAKVLQQVSSKMMPDVLMLDNGDLPQIASSGALAPLSDFDINVDGYADGVIEASSYDGDLYAVQPVANTIASFVNTDMLAAAGVDVPTTWDELKTAAAALSGDGKYGMAFSATATEEGTFQFLPFFWSNGGDETDIATEAVAEALQLWVDLVDSGSASESVLTWTQADVNDQFVAGNTAMMVNGPWQFPSLDEAGVPYEVVSIPAPQDGDEIISPLGGEVWTIPQTGNEAKMTAAASVVECLGSDESQMALASGRDLVPTNTELVDQFIAENPKMAGFAEQVPGLRARTAQLGADYTAASEGIYTAIQTALTGGADPLTALQQSAPNK